MTNVERRLKGEGAQKVGGQSRLLQRPDPGVFL